MKRKKKHDSTIVLFLMLGMYAGFFLIAMQETHIVENKEKYPTLSMKLYIYSENETCATSDPEFIPCKLRNIEGENQVLLMNPYPGEIEWEIIEVS